MVYSGVAAALYKSEVPQYVKDAAKLNRITKCILSNKIDVWLFYVEEKYLSDYIFFRGCGKLRISCDG